MFSLTKYIHSKYSKIALDLIKLYLNRQWNHLKYHNSQKIFCIGLNKTGTTSLVEAMDELGFKTGNQVEAEKLFKDWVKRDFKRLKKYCKKAEFFQDVPFSLPYTFIALDQAFPGSKFILTMRNDDDQWYKSVTRFHAKLWGKEKRIPTKQDLKEAKYIEKGYPYHFIKNTFNTSDNNPYDEKTLKTFYNNHNKTVIDYFRNRPEDLLILNVSENNAYQKLCNFLNINCEQQEFPWKNKTQIVTNEK